MIPAPLLLMAPSAWLFCILRVCAAPSRSCTVLRLRLSGSVYGRRLAANLGDATQAVGVRLRTPSGHRLVAVTTHWQASPIEDAEGLASAAELEARFGAPAGEENSRTQLIKPWPLK